MLYVFDAHDDFNDTFPSSALRLEQYVQHPPAWQPDSESTLLQLSGLSEAATAALWRMNPFGWYDFLIPQMREAQERLRQQQFALLCPVYEGRSQFLMLEPHNDLTYLSVLNDLPDDIYYGINFFSTIPFHFLPDSRAAQKTALYAYIAAHRRALQPDNHAASYVMALQNIPLSTTDLIVDFEENYRFGQQFLALMHTR